MAFSYGLPRAPWITSRSPGVFSLQERLLGRMLKVTVTVMTMTMMSASPLETSKLERRSIRMLFFRFGFRFPVWDLSHVGHKKNKQTSIMQFGGQWGHEEDKEFGLYIFTDGRNVSFFPLPGRTERHPSTSTLNLRHPDLMDKVWLSRLQLAVPQFHGQQQTQFKQTRAL